MRYLKQHIKTIVTTYNGQVPLTHFLRGYCKANPKLGSRDRRVLSAVVYSWYRCGDGLLFENKKAINLPELMENTISKCLELCRAATPEVLRFADTLEANGSLPIYDADLLLPADIPFSGGIERAQWLQSMLKQPDLFIRVRKRMEEAAEILTDNGIVFTRITDSCWSLPNGTPIDKLLPAENYVVQDASSQATGSYFNPEDGQHWLDCCAGAGGKSLLLADKGKQIHLTVADKRASIINNLKERFIQYGLKVPKTIVADMSAPNQSTSLRLKAFDNIICDVPCSGSGTWARTPEQRYFFDPESLHSFSATQQAIATNAANYLKPGGKLFYITCSVFRQENEDVVSAVSTKTGLEVTEQHIINGIDLHADSMFIAILQ